MQLRRAKAGRRPIASGGVSVDLVFGPCSALLRCFVLVNSQIIIGRLRQCWGSVWVLFILSIRMLAQGQNL